MEKKPITAETENSKTDSSKAEPLQEDASKTNQSEGGAQGFINTITSKATNFFQKPDKTTGAKIKWVRQMEANEPAKWFREVGFRLDDNDVPNEIILIPEKGQEELADDELELLREVKIASVRLSTAFREYPQEREQLYYSLMDVVVNGFYGKNTEIKLAKLYFAAFKSMVPIESQKVRRRFLLSTIICNLIVVFVSLVFISLWLPMHYSVFSDMDTAFSLCQPSVSNNLSEEVIKNDASQKAIKRHSYCDGLSTSLALNVTSLLFPNWSDLIETKRKSYADTVNKTSNLILGYGLAIIGGAIGLLLTGFLRSREITYEGFDDIYRYGMRPGRYLLLITILALVLLIMLEFNVFILGVGSVVLNDISSNPLFGLLIGLLCSISEPIVSKMVIDRMKPAETKGSK